jgi:hypothetical protein
MGIIKEVFGSKEKNGREWDQIDPGGKDLEEMRRQLYTATATTATGAMQQENHELTQARASARNNQLAFQALQSAVRSIVLRLKVLDLDQMEKEMKDDGTVPLRFALSELRALVAAYDERKDPVAYGLGGMTVSATTTATSYYRAPNSSTCANPNWRYMNGR